MKHEPRIINQNTMTTREFNSISKVHMINYNSNKEKPSLQITLNSAESGVSCTGIQSSASNYSVDVRFWAISMSVNHPCQGCHFKRVSNLLNETLPTFQINTQNFFSPVPFRWALTITLFSLWKFIQQQETLSFIIVQMNELQLSWAKEREKNHTFEF